MPTEWSNEIVVCDLADEPELSDELTALYTRLTESPDGQMPNVVLDMSGLTYLNSSNIAQMLRLRKVLNEADKSMRLCSVGDPIWSIMLLTGLEKVFQFAPDKATALASLQIEGGAR